MNYWIASAAVAIASVTLLLERSLVLGQVQFPSGTTINCYGTSSTCSGTPTATTLDYAADGVFEVVEDGVNPCCMSFQPFMEHYGNYYTALGSRCQSCSDQNVFTDYRDVVDCYDNLECNGAVEVYEGYTFNVCCGGMHFLTAYVVNGGECLPCVQMPEASGGADPHFMSPMKNGHNLCYSVQGIAKFIFNLITDSTILINAKFALPQAEESRLLTNSSTFIQQLGITISHPITFISTKVKISALDHSILIADDFITVDNYPISINIINNTVITAVETVNANPDHDETAWVNMATDVGFGLKFKFTKKHINYVITDSSGVSAHAHGIQGQFMGAEVSIDQDAKLMKVGDHQVPFGVEEGEIWPYLDLKGSCWYPINTDMQGGGVLEGVYTDYIVEDLFSNAFRYNKF